MLASKLAGGLEARWQHFCVLSRSNHLLPCWFGCARLPFADGFFGIAAPEFLDNSHSHRLRMFAATSRPGHCTCGWRWAPEETITQKRIAACSRGSVLCSTMPTFARIEQWWRQMSIMPARTQRVGANGNIPLVAFSIRDRGVKVCIGNVVNELSAALLTGNSAQGAESRKMSHRGDTRVFAFAQRSETNAGHMQGCSGCPQAMHAGFRQCCCYLNQVVASQTQGADAESAPRDSSSNLSNSGPETTALRSVAMQ